MHNISQALKYIEKRSILKYILLGLPVLIYCLPFLLTAIKLSPGDADYLMQTQEAARISILKYHQFPWWNPWISGGVPLYANLQYGLFSFTTIFTLLFGSIIGYKISLVVYLLIGFYSMRILLIRIINTQILTANLLSYIWIFSSYFSYRIAGHYTFFIITLFPLMLYLYYRLEKIKFAYLWLGITLALMINSAPHNTAVMTVYVFSIFILYDIFRRFAGKELKNKLLSNKNYLIFLFKSFVIAGLLSLHKLYYSFEYFKEYPRNLGIPDTTVGVFKGIYAIFGPFRQYNNPPSIPNWSWMEISAYIGVFTGIALLLALYGNYKNNKNKRISVDRKILIAIAIITFTLGLGKIFGVISPYYIASKLPLLSGMRVAERWFEWTSLISLILIGTYKGLNYRKIINILLLLSVVELFLRGSFFMTNAYVISPSEYSDSQVINQQINYDDRRLGIPYDENFTFTTRANIGQIVAGDSLIDTRQGVPSGEKTVRCGNCNFIISNNATVKSWSPNKIILSRYATGVIKLNMNPGKYWQVNGSYVFSKMRLSEPSKEFNIDDESNEITVELVPKFSFRWMTWKISHL